MDIRQLKTPSYIDIVLTSSTILDSDEVWEYINSLNKKRVSTWYYETYNMLYLAGPKIQTLYEDVEYYVKMANPKPKDVNSAINTIFTFFIENFVKTYIKEIVVSAENFIIGEFSSGALITNINDLKRKNFGSDVLLEVRKNFFKNLEAKLRYGIIGLYSLYLNIEEKIKEKSLEAIFLRYAIGEKQIKDKKAEDALFESYFNFALEAYEGSIQNAYSNIVGPFEYFSSAIVIENLDDYRIKNAKRIFDEGSKKVVKEEKDKEAGITAEKRKQMKKKADELIWGKDVVDKPLPWKIAAGLRGLGDFMRDTLGIKYDPSKVDPIGNLLMKAAGGFIKQISLRKGSGESAKILDYLKRGGRSWYDRDYDWGGRDIRKGIEEREKILNEVLKQLDISRNQYESDSNIKTYVDMIVNERLMQLMKKKKGRQQPSSTQQKRREPKEPQQSGSSSKGKREGRRKKAGGGSTSSGQGKKKAKKVKEDEDDDDYAKEDNYFYRRLPQSENIRQESKVGKLNVEEIDFGSKKTESLVEGGGAKGGAYDFILEQLSDFINAFKKVLNVFANISKKAIEAGQSAAAKQVLDQVSVSKEKDKKQEAPQQSDLLFKREMPKTKEIRDETTFIRGQIKEKGKPFAIMAPETKAISSTIRAKSPVTGIRGTRVVTTSMGGAETEIFTTGLKGKRKGSRQSQPLRGKRKSRGSESGVMQGIKGKRRRTSGLAGGGTGGLKGRRIRTGGVARKGTVGITRRVGATAAKRAASSGLGLIGKFLGGRGVAAALGGWPALLLTLANTAKTIYAGYKALRPDVEVPKRPKPYTGTMRLNEAQQEALKQVMAGGGMGGLLRTSYDIKAGEAGRRDIAATLSQAQGLIGQNLNMNYKQNMPKAPQQTTTQTQQNQAQVTTQQASSEKSQVNETQILEKSAQVSTAAAATMAAGVAQAANQAAIQAKTRAVERGEERLETP